VAALWTLKTVLISALKLLHPYMPFITEEIFMTIQSKEESIMISEWPKYRADWDFLETSEAIETIKEAVRGIRNVRAQMNVAPSKKVKVIVVSDNEKVRDIFESGKVFFMALSHASEVSIQADKAGISEDAVSTVIHEAVIYMPFAELVDVEKEVARLKNEEEKLSKEILRATGMLNNPNFVNKAPEAKVNEEKEKLEKYMQMLQTVKERLETIINETK